MNSFVYTSTSQQTYLRRQRNNRFSCHQVLLPSDVDASAYSRWKWVLERVMFTLVCEECNRGQQTSKTDALLNCRRSLADTNTKFLHHTNALFLVLGTRHPEFISILHDLRQDGSSKEHHVLSTWWIFNADLKFLDTTCCKNIYKTWHKKPTLLWGISIHSVVITNYYSILWWCTR